jgi:transposase
MLSLNSYRIFLYAEGCDMRKGFDGLSGIVRNEMNLDPLNGSVFVFFNKRRTLIKLLVWDLTGFSIYYKRLCEGTFGKFHLKTTSLAQVISREELLCVLEGIELNSIRKRRRYLHPILI